MAVTFKNEKKDDQKPAVALVDNASADKQASDSDDAKKEDPAVVALKKQLADAETNADQERKKRVDAEKDRDDANSKAVSNQNEAIKAQKAAIENASQVAIGNVNTIKKELQEAMEAGDLTKQVDLQEKLADARWQFNNAEHSKKQFAAWEEQQKNSAKTSVAGQQYSKTEQAWIDKHPRFNTDNDYFEVVAGADAAARRRGIKPDTDAYYEYVESALVKRGMEEDPKTGIAVSVDSEDDDGGRDNTGAMDQEDDDAEPVQKPAKQKQSMPSAPASNSAPTTPATRSAKSFKLSAEMRDMAHRMFGPNSSHKLSQKQAEEKYAAHQLDIRERRANGERI